MVLQSLAGLPAFLVYFCTAIIAVVAYLFIYTRVTPHDEFQLIRDNDPAGDCARPKPAWFRAAGGQRYRPLGQCRGLSDLERDRADRSGRRLLCRQNTGAQPVGEDRGGRTGTGDLARAGVARRRRAQRRLDDLLIMAEKPNMEFGRRRPAAI